MRIILIAFLVVASCIPFIAEAKKKVIASTYEFRNARTEHLVSLNYS